MAADPLHVVQLSDLHFSTAPDGYGMRDTAETFAAVAAHVLADPPDLIVVTGDIAHEGKPDEYELAGAALAALGLPTFCLPGNHDFADALHAHLPRPGIVVQRSMRVGEWLFLFGDSNEDGVVFDDAEGWVDHDDRMELARGGVHSHELSWLRRQVDLGSAAHGMLWVHHPPAGPGMFARPEYDERIATLVNRATPLRGVAAGHVHTGVERALAGTTVYLCPSTGVSIDFEESRMMPPGYRRYRFHSDGGIDSDVVWLDDDRWNKRWELPEWAILYLAGELSEEEMQQRRAELRA
ncbi:MAG: metallophosphoesterase family protein [Microthrixaceae bacterium]